MTEGSNVDTTGSRTGISGLGWGICCCAPTLITAPSSPEEPLTHFFIFPVSTSYTLSTDRSVSRALSPASLPHL